jgi:sec-independent protein translocase protein TatA
MGRFGTMEILLILVVALLFFGTSRIADIGKGLGEAIRDFKKGIRDNDDEDAPDKITEGKTEKAEKKGDAA